MSKFPVPCDNNELVELMKHIACHYNETEANTKQVIHDNDAHNLQDTLGAMNTIIEYMRFFNEKEEKKNGV